MNALLDGLRVGVEGLRILVQQLGLADSLVCVAHFVVYSTSSDLGSLSPVVRQRLLLLAHLVVVPRSVHFTNYFTISA